MLNNETKIQLNKKNTDLQKWTKMTEQAQFERKHFEFFKNMYTGLNSFPTKFVWRIFQNTFKINLLGHFVAFIMNIT